ncbi:hypothetical protein ACIPK9_37255 [Streptomyces sp. NPDC086771]|uniref:hypothetical protein n=1 Tax=unclassified Streptomyces TaxID=2593676 RepID=UPI003815DEB3
MTFLRRLFRRRPAPSAATFSPTGITTGTRWLVCDTTACAHLTTRHTPHGTGYQCTRCGTTKEGQ